MEMNQQLKDDGEKAAEIFLQGMDQMNWKRYQNKNMHHQLAYFFCWCELMQDEMKNET